MSWRYQPKPQPEATKFRVPPVDAPNVNGARMFGLVPGAAGDRVGEADLSALRAAVEAGSVAALYVFDPGPEGSLGRRSGFSTRARAGKLPLLIVQGVLLTPTSRGPPISCCRAHPTSRRKRLTPTTRAACRATARAIPPPGDAMEDWQILVNLAHRARRAVRYTSAAHVRADIASRYADVPGIRGHHHARVRAAG